MRSRATPSNNASENISATRHLLANRIGLDDDDVGDAADIAGEPEILEAAEGNLRLPPKVIDQAPRLGAGFF